MPKTLYVTDLDGTFFHPGAVVSPQSARMINGAIDHGVLFTVATARTPATVAPLLSDIRLRIPAVVMTGAANWNQQTGEYSNVHHIDNDTARELVKIYRAMDFPTFLYTLRGDMIHIYHIGELSDLERQFVAERIDSPFKTFHIPVDGNSVLPEYLGDTILFYGFQPENLAAATFNYTCKVPNCRPSKYHDFYGPEIGILEAFSPLSTKARAIRTLADSLGVHRIVAFGDNLNDIPMLELADVGVAVENAIPEVREAADLIIGPNDTDSVAKFILQDSGLNHLLP